jgi:hypothetical protein
VKKHDKEKTVEKDVDLSRRKFLLGGASVLVGGALAGSIGGALVKPRAAHAALPGYFPKPAALIDLNLTRKLAWHHYFKSGG